MVKLRRKFSSGLLERRTLRLPLLVLGPLVLVLGAGYYYVTGGRYVSTDDAYVRADKVQISSDVAGRVIAVDVRDNQRVAKGDVLFTLDDAPYRIALARAEAQLAAARNNIDAMKANFHQKEAALQQSKDSLEFMRREYDRQAKLAQTSVVSVSALDQARRNFDVGRQQVSAMQQDLAQTFANLGGNADINVDDHPQVKAAIAARDQAALDLAHTRITAPDDGIVARADLRPGQYIQSGQPVFALVEIHHLYFEANIKETDLTHVSPGQSATIDVDTFPGRRWRAVVVSVSPGTGAEFSILPPQNATGNWVKVVQRVPVRLVLSPGEDGSELRAGMSVSVEIDTRHSNPLPGAIDAAQARNDAGK